MFFLEANLKVYSYALIDFFIKKEISKNPLKA